VSLVFAAIASASDLPRESRKDISGSVHEAMARNGTDKNIVRAGNAFLQSEADRLARQLTAHFLQTGQMEDHGVVSPETAKKFAGVEETFEK
jgi:hypothetical protein